MRQGARQGAPAPRTERCRQKERSVHSVRFCLLPYEIIKKTTRKAQSVLGKRARAIGKICSERKERGKQRDRQGRLTKLTGGRKCAKKRRRARQRLPQASDDKKTIILDKRA